jgi:hypothetical protein
MATLKQIMIRALGGALGGILTLLIAAMLGIVTLAV